MSSPEKLEIANKEFQEGNKQGCGWRIRLNGGIGDHLQDIALIHWWNNSHKVQIQLETEQKRVKQLNSLIEDDPHLKLIATDAAPENHPMTSLGFEGTLHYCEENIIYSPWLQKKYPAKAKREILIFCWQSNGADDKFSCFSRSVPFNKVLNFYREILTKKPNQKIIDITNWRRWEKSSLNSIGINFYDPSSGDVKQLLQLINGGEVISIDTALSHLCACIGQNSIMLLPFFPDERWKELHQEHNCYGKYIEIIQQKKFGCWEYPLEFLQNKLCR